ncbi:MAG: hypothetical protein AAFU86_12125 [Pseudomonadota bacterium]
MTRALALVASIAARVVPGGPGVFRYSLVTPPGVRLGFGRWAAFVRNAVMRQTHGGLTTWFDPFVCAMAPAPLRRGGATFRDNGAVGALARLTGESHENAGLIAHGGGWYSFDARRTPRPPACRLRP